MIWRSVQVRITKSLSVLISSIPLRACNLNHNLINHQNTSKLTNINIKIIISKLRIIITKARNNRCNRARILTPSSETHLRLRCWLPTKRTCPACRSQVVLRCKIHSIRRIPETIYSRSTQQRTYWNPSKQVITLLQTCVGSDPRTVSAQLAGKCKGATPCIMNRSPNSSLTMKSLTLITWIQSPRQAARVTILKSLKLGIKVETRTRFRTLLSHLS